jgi:hypothetical protein
MGTHRAAVYLIAFIVIPKRQKAAEPSFGPRRLPVSTFLLSSRLRPLFSIRTSYGPDTPWWARSDWQ